MTTPTPQPACSPLDYTILSDGASLQFDDPIGATRAVVTTFCDQELLRLLANAPETARLLRELVEAVEKMRGCLVAGAVHETEMAAVVALEEAITIHDANFTPLLTQIQKLEGGGE